jgi:hypothetical protein
VAPPSLHGIDRANPKLKEDIMSDAKKPARIDRTHTNDTVHTAANDPDMSSTWNTIDGTADADDLLNEEDFEDLLMEPTTGELGVLSDTDVPGEPG